MTILEEIIMEKEKEVLQLKQEKICFEAQNRKRRSLYESFRQSDRLHVIAEIKRASPSKGDIQTEVNPVLQARQYVEAGAGAISVLTDTPFFKGSMRDLQDVRQVVDVPVLCKDFIIDPIQIDRAKHYGADVILLIVAALSKGKLIELYKHAVEQNLEVLLEVHNEEELCFALDLDARIIGINNRNLKTFDVHLGVTEKLAKLVNKEEILLISESGFREKSDAIRAVNAGAKGILVGETLMRTDNVQATIEDLRADLSGTRL